MEVSCKEKCQCCKACKQCSGFQKILDLTDAGLVVYRHTKRMDQIHKSTGNLENSINTTDDVFIIQNTRDFQIKTDDCESEIDDEVTCLRCRELIQRAQKYLRNIPSINKKDVISVCDHCKTKERSIKYYCECHEVVKKFLAEKNKKSVGKEQIKTWLSKIQKILLKNLATDKKTELKYRAHSDLYLNKLHKDVISSPRKLEVGPMLEVGVRVADWPSSMDKIVPKSESALKCLDSKKATFKSALVKSASFIEMERHTSSSLDTYDTSLDKDIDRIKEDLELDSFERMRQIRVRDKEFAQKTTVTHRGSALPIKKYYSEEKISFSAAGFEDIKRNFSYVFPKEESEVIRPLRRVKTSAELIEDTRDKMQLRIKLLKDEITRQLVKRSKISSKKQNQPSVKKSDEQDVKISGSQESVKKYGENLEGPSRKKGKTKDMEIKSDKDEIQKQKKTLRKDIESPKLKTDQKKEKNIKNIRREMDEKHKDKKEELEREKGKKDKEKKEELQKEKEKKEKEKKEELQKEKEKKEELQKEKEKKEKEKKEEMLKEKERKEKEKQFQQRLKDEQKKSKDEQFKNKDEKLQNKDDKAADKIKIKDEQAKSRMEAEKKTKEESERKLKALKEVERKTENGKSKHETKKEEPTSKDVNIEEIKSKDEKIKNKGEKPQKEDDRAADSLKKMMEEQARAKAEAVSIRKQQEEENKRLRQEAEKKTKEEAEKKLKEEAERKLKSFKETKFEKKPDTEPPKHETKQEEPTIKELNIKQIKIRKPSQDDLILRLVKIRQLSKNVERRRPKRLSEINITPLMVKEHKVHKARKILSCAICVDSELELDVENITNNKNKPDEATDLILGNKIIKSEYPLSNKPPEEMLPVLYKSLFTEDIAPKQQQKVAETMTDITDHKPPPPLSHKFVEQELPKGIIRYALSDRSFIDKGWTMLPTEKVVRKMNVYRMRPAHPEFDWFDRNKNKRLMLYDTGEKLAEFDDNGRGRWFYRNGRLALDYYDAEEMNAQQRFVIYGSGEPDERGRYQPISILATFDYLGNGVVFDHTGKIRLKYNQTEGVVLDRGIGPVSHWKWHTLNDPPVLQQVMIDTQMAHKDPDILKLGGPGDDKARPDNEEMLAIEFDNFIKEKSKKLSQKFKPFQIRTKALKINENFSLRVLDQATIYLIFRDGTTNIKMNIGMILDHQEIVDTDTAEVGEVSNNLERFPARTNSLAGLQRSVAYAQRVERLRVERQRRLKHPEPVLSADRLAAAASRPVRSQLNVVPSSSTTAKDECLCKCRKPSTSNVYYDTRLV